jgi:hypothetical protein
VQASTISAAKEQALNWMRYVVSVSKKILSCLILVYFILKTGKRQGRDERKTGILDFIALKNFLLYNEFYS